MGSTNVYPWLYLKNCFWQAAYFHFQTFEPESIYPVISKQASKAPSPMAGKVSNTSVDKINFSHFEQRDGARQWQMSCINSVVYVSLRRCEITLLNQALTRPLISMQLSRPSKLMGFRFAWGKFTQKASPKRIAVQTESLLSHLFVDMD